MAGLISFAVGGLAYILIGAHESLAPFLLLPQSTSSSSSFRYAAALVLSLLYILRSLYLALFSSSPHHDPVALPLHLSSAAAASAFLLFSLSGLLRARLRLPRSLLDLLLLSAFTVELLSIRLSARGADSSSGIERRYFDLLLVPVLACAASTLLALARPGSPSLPLARGIGLVLHGSWLVQMGFSFFSSAIAHGCALQRRSSGNYTIKCKGHPEYHRGRAIATLQFNCHLAFLVLVAAAVYSVVVARRWGGAAAADYSEYRPLNEMQRILPDDHDDYSNHSHHHQAASAAAANFTLDSDEDDDDDDGVATAAEKKKKKEEASSGEILDAMKQQQHKEISGTVIKVLPKEGANGFGGASL